MEIGKLNSLAASGMIRAVLHLALGAKPEVVPCGYRIANVDRLRVLSVSAVVFFHMCSDSVWARHLGTIGILVFLLSLSIFVVNRPGQLDLAEVLRRKTQRLLKPWLFWSTVYGMVALLKVLHPTRGVPFSDAFGWTMLLIGTRIHLWFLPFSFVAVMLLALIHRAITGASNSFVITAAIVLGTLSVAGCAMIQSCVQPPTPLRQWILGAPAMFLGLAIGRIMLQEKAEDKRNLYLFTVLLMGAVCAVFLWILSGLWADYAGKFAIRYCVAAALVCFGLHWQGSLDPISKKLASLSYGIYLVHPLVEIVLSELGIAVERPYVSLLLVLVFSALAADVIKRTPFFRQFI